MIVLAPRSLEEYAHNYNKMPEVNDSYQAVLSNGQLETFWKEICDVAKSYDLVDIICIRLIHKHWKLESGQIMFEQKGSYDGQEATVSKATVAKTLKKPYVPSWWYPVDGKYEGAEFTSDPLIIEAFSKLETRGKFFKDFFDITVRYNLNEYLAPALRPRPVSKEEHPVFLEYNESNASYVVMENKEEASRTSTPTTWILQDPGTIFDDSFAIWACYYKCVNYGKGNHDSYHS